MPFGFCVSGGLPALWSSPVEHWMHRPTGRHSTGPAASCQLSWNLAPAGLREPPNIRTTELPNAFS